MPDEGQPGSRIAGEEPSVSIRAPVELSRLWALHIPVNGREPGALSAYMPWLRRSALPTPLETSLLYCRDVSCPGRPANGSTPSPSRMDR